LQADRHGKRRFALMGVVGPGVVTHANLVNGLRVKQTDSRLLGNVRVQARIAEIMRAGAERAEVTVEQVVRELKLIGFSDKFRPASRRSCAPGLSAPR
jgi:hypothetical protein